LRADKDVALEHAVAIMNLCNKVGIADYTLTTEGESDEP
jgi:biopolymer transport protein ExbD